jgi:hypothetical protein
MYSLAFFIYLHYKCDVGMDAGNSSWKEKANLGAVRLNKKPKFSIPKKPKQRWGFFLIDFLMTYGFFI